jgi:hypothetical protein
MTEGIWIPKPALQSLATQAVRKTQLINQRDTPSGKRIIRLLGEHLSGKALKETGSKNTSRCQEDLEVGQEALGADTSELKKNSPQTGW